MPKRPTLADVAQDVGLSPAAVSYALRGERGADETVERVREAAERLGYQADPIARALASGSTGSVAILCATLGDPWQRTLTADLARSLRRQGRHALMADADGSATDEVALLRTLADQRPDGLLVAPLDPFAERWRELAERLPVVAIGDRLSAAPRAGAVVYDNPRGMRLVLEMLAELGHRRIAVLLPERPTTPDRPAEDFVATESTRLGLALELVHVSPPTSAEPAGPSRLRALLSGPDRPSAVFGLSDVFALDALRTARDLGLEVPGDLSVVGFDDVDIADLVGPGLTTVNWGRTAVSETAVGMLLARIDSQAPMATRVMPPRLVLRGTTGPPSPR